MTQQPNPAPTAPEPRLDHNPEWDAPDGPEPQHKPSDVHDRGVLDSVGRAVTDPLRPPADSPAPGAPR